MSATAVVQAAVVAALRARPGLAALSGVFDAPPVRSALPHAVVDAPVLVDWSTKTWRGREGRLTVMLHDAGERPVRLRGLTGEVEDAVEALAPDLGEGWRTTTLVLARSRIARGAGDRWLAASEFQLRMWRVN